MYDFNEIRMKYFEKRCKQLSSISESRDLLSLYNTALIDNDINKIDIISNMLEKQGKQWNTINVSDSIINKDRLKIIYLLPHSGITGGIKIIIEQSNRLADMGHDVMLYSHSPKPNWIECKCPYFQVNPENNIYHVTPKADVVIAGYWDLVIDALKIKAPLKYHFAQGDYDIFKFNQLSESEKRIIYTSYTLPLKILTVSNIMIKKLNENFGRKAVLIPNAIDTKYFYAKKSSSINNKCLTVLLVGSDSIAFKNHRIIIAALCKMQEIGYKLKIKWITQNKLINDYGKLGLIVEEFIACEQTIIGDIYRASDIFISASLYEAFSLTVLEAMTCGTPVITSDNGGIKDYCEDKMNCLIFNPRSIEELVEKLIILFDNLELRKKFSVNGLKTSKKYTWAKSTKILNKELVTDAENTTGAFWL
ncbi:MAG: glycosyltransferase family 4 protein [Candidatus Gastranaerophilales bacterium]|nr:glycosyltransferase family 4 protein [Candidatus Gastranaerophilales bacterium]